MQTLDFWDDIFNLHITNNVYKKTPKEKKNYIFCNIQLLWENIRPDRMYQKQNLPASLSSAQLNKI